MFGSNDKNQADNTQQNINPAGGAVPVAAPPEEPLIMAPPDPVITPTAPPLNDAMPAAPIEPLLPTQPEPPEVSPPAIIKNSDSSPKDTPAPPPLNADEDELMGIKQQALHSLAPLVNHLEQTPEEKFKTTMMLIQASDNASLIKDAHDAANAIPDEKARAQALLDVVNEINYFTQHQNQEQN